MIPEQEGWYTDPWGHHDARWISEGVPSKLVRDADVESYEDPPDSPPSQAWVAIAPPPGSLSPTDSLRVDSLEAGTMPTLAELNRTQDSAAITAGAHPWFIARHWIREPSAKPIGSARRAALISGGVLVGLILLLTTYLWVVDVIAMFTHPPPLWGGVLIGAVFALVPPTGTYLMWRSDRKAKVPMRLRIQRAEMTGTLLSILALFVFIGSHLTG